MKTNQSSNPRKVFGLLAAIMFVCLPLLQADVVVLQSGAVITGNILQQDANGVLLQMEYGTYRYPLAWIRDIKKEPTTAPPVANNGQALPDWAQIVTLLAHNGWAQGLKQVPAAMIETNLWKNVPYISFRSAGGYELHIFGDLDKPAAVQIGAMNYLHQTSAQKSNCVNFICSVLNSAADRDVVRSLNFDRKDTQKNGAMTFETILPGEWGSYGGWWISVYDINALVNAQASESEILALTQSGGTTYTTNVTSTTYTTTYTTNVTSTASGFPPPPFLPPPPTATNSSQTTSSGTYSTASGWTPDDLAAARAATPTTAPAAPNNNVYPRIYTRAGGSYGPRR